MSVLCFALGVYWIEILREYFDKNNLEDFKRLCGIVLILCDFKRFFFERLFTIRILNKENKNDRNFKPFNNKVIIV